MSIATVRYGLVALAALVIGAALTGCGEDSDSSTGSGDLQNVKVVVVENNTSKRVAGACIVVDSKTDEACYTSEPGGDTGGECFFVLSQGEHRFVVSKPTYHTTDTTRLVTSMTSSIFISIFR
jgi:hypothetical protein